MVIKLEPNKSASDLELFTKLNKNRSLEPIDDFETIILALYDGGHYNYN